MKDFWGPILCVVLGVMLSFCIPIAHADMSSGNLTIAAVQNIIHAKTLTHGSTLTQAVSFKPLSTTVNQSVQFQVTGVSPNYKVEVQCSMDGTNFTKPEAGGDLGTFTDANMHYVALKTPLSTETKLKFTELGGVNDETVEATEASQ